MVTIIDQNHLETKGDVVFFLSDQISHPDTLCTRVHLAVHQGVYRYTNTTRLGILRGKKGEGWMGSGQRS
jgi:hypothetical protein